MATNDLPSTRRQSTPWNELADAAAKQIAHDPATSATTRQQLDWFFLARLAPIERLQYPPLLDGAFAVTNHEEVPSRRDVASMLDGSSKNVRRESAPCPSAISLRVAFANVHTLSPCDDTVDGPTLSVMGRISVLESQFSQLGFQFVGIQEGRMRTSALRVCPEYFCWGMRTGALGASSGSTRRPWNGNNAGTEEFFTPADFQVMFATERMTTRLIWWLATLQVMLGTLLGTLNGETRETLLGNALRRSASPRKRLGSLITRLSSFDRSGPPCGCGLIFDGALCRESWRCGGLRSVARSHLHHADAPGTDVCHAGHHCTREGSLATGY